jgi:regulator of telomere elongation helicase 1
LKEKLCPFYLSRELAATANVVFMPYNYLLDPKVRSQSNIVSFENAVLIFDEAHNVQRVSEESSSAETSIEELKKCLNEINQLEKMKQSMDLKEESYEGLEEITYDDIKLIKEPVESFIHYLNNMKGVSSEGLVYEGKMLFDIFLNGTEYTDTRLEGHTVTKAINNDNVNQYLDTAKKCVKILIEHNIGSHIDQWSYIVEKVYSYLAQQVTDNKSDIDFFKTVITDEIEDSVQSTRKRSSKTKAQRRALKALCFNPGLAFIDILKANPQCIIFTSGTLSPMESLEKELRMSFPIKLEADHVISKEQLLIQVVTHDCENALFNFNYANRKNERQRENLGKLIEEVCCRSPGGVLVFFSGYAMMSQCWTMWKETFIPAIKDKTGKKVYKEEKTMSENKKVIEEFTDSVNKQGAVLFAVCRGKISEGIDFSDNAGRTVIVIGVPFSLMTSKRVTLKQEYLNKHTKELNISGKTWYTQEAMKAVNQSIGRVIRHAKDYGAIMLIDQRYSSSWLKNYLSKWLRNQVKVNNHAQCIELLGDFFKSMGSKEYSNEPKVITRTLKFKPVTVVKNTMTNRIEVKKRKQNVLNSVEIDKMLEKYRFKSTKEEVKVNKMSKEKWMKETYDMLSNSLGKERFKRFMGVFQEFIGCAERVGVSDLAKTVYELFRSKEHLDINTIEQDNKVMRRTVRFIDKQQRKEYESCLLELIKNNS